jgi:hypothetical protein
LKKRVAIDGKKWERLAISVICLAIYWVLRCDIDGFYLALPLLCVKCHSFASDATPLRFMLLSCAGTLPTLAPLMPLCQLSWLGERKEWGKKERAWWLAAS